MICTDISIPSILQTTKCPTNEVKYGYELRSRKESGTNSLLLKKAQYRAPEKGIKLTLHYF